MKKLLLAASFLSMVAISCSKDDNGDATTEVYLNTAAGSTWRYENVDNSPGGTTTEYTRTSTSRDTMIGSRNYHVFTKSTDGSSEYNAKSGSDYFIYQALPPELGGTNVENLYLKSASSVNASWSQSYNINVPGIPFAITVNLTNKLVEKGVARTVNGVNYENVMHVKTDVGISGLPPGTVTITSDIQQYYAPNYGLVEARNKIDIDFLGTVQSTDVTTRLKTATLL